MTALPTATPYDPACNAGLSTINVFPCAAAPRATLTVSVNPWPYLHVKINPPSFKPRYLEFTPQSGGAPVQSNVTGWDGLKGSVSVPEQVCATNPLTQWKVSLWSLDASNPSQPQNSGYFALFTPSCRALVH